MDCSRLWDIFSTLAEEVPIYLNEMDEDMDSTPDSYILINENTYDHAITFGDGEDLLRESNFSIYITSSNKEFLKSYKKKIKNILKANKIQYEQYAEVPDFKTGNYSVELEGRLFYGD